MDDSIIGSTVFGLAVLQFVAGLLPGYTGVSSISVGSIVSWLCPGLSMWWDLRAIAVLLVEYEEMSVREALELCRRPLPSVGSKGEIVMSPPVKLWRRRIGGLNPKGPLFWRAPALNTRYTVNRWTFPGPFMQGGGVEVTRQGGGVSVITYSDGTTVTRYDSGTNTISSGRVTESAWVLSVGGWFGLEAPKRPVTGLIAEGGRSFRLVHHIGGRRRHFLLSLGAFGLVNTILTGATLMSGVVEGSTATIFAINLYTELAAKLCQCISYGG